MTATERSEGGSAEGVKTDSLTVNKFVKRTPVRKNKRSISTTLEWKWAKIARAPQASQVSGPKGLKWRLLPKRDPRVPLTLSIKHRGGPEQWVEIHARGQVGRYPGWVCIADIVRDLNGLS